MSNQEENKDKLNFNISKENPFKVPANYFENLPNRISERVLIETQKNIPWWKLFFFRPSFAIGFSVAVLLVVAFLFYPQNNTEKFSSQLAENSGLYTYLTFDESVEVEMAEAYYFQALQSNNSRVENVDESEQLAQILVEDDMVWTDLIDDFY